MAVSHRWILRLLVAGIATAIALFIADVLVSRLLPEPAKETPPAVEQAAASAYQQAPWIGQFAGRTVDMHAIIQPFSWEPHTGAAANSWGFRTPEFTLAAPPRTVRVVVVGDSITWGQGVAMDDTFWAVLERELTPEVQALGLDVEVIALGVCGSRLVDNVIRLAALGERLRPDVVIVQYFPNDLEDQPKFRHRDILDELGRQSSLLRAVRLVRDRDAFWDQLAARTDPASREWAQFSAAAEALGAWRRSHGIPVLVAAFPPSDLRPNGGNFDEYRGLAEFASILEPPLQAFRDSGVDVIDLKIELGRQAGRQYLCASESDGHPNALAHGIIGRTIAERIRDSDSIGGWAATSRPGDSTHAVERKLRDQSTTEWPTLNAAYPPQRVLVDSLLEIHPNEPWLIAQSAALDQEMGRFPQACAGWRQLADIAPDSAAPWYHMSRCAPDDESRAASLARMLEVVPNHAPSVEEQLNLATRRGDTSLACDRAVELGRVARYPEQFARAHDAFQTGDCEGLGFDFWGTASDTPSAVAN